MQAYPRLAGIALQQADGMWVVHRRGVKQVDLAPVALLRQRLHARNERG
jgi:hypothetical protein